MITLKNITLRRRTKVVLQDATVTLQPGEKIGLVGRNGAGKSSLFSLLTNRLQADAGDLALPPRWRVAEVLQSMPESAESATDYVLQGDTRLMEAQAALAAAEAADDGHAMAEAHHLIDEAGGFEARPRAQALLLGLGFRSNQLDDAVSSFSGGWRMRLQLARALMCPADLMLLDEPTNHLDLDALVWLEAWLQRFDGTLIVISHDREFLDAITRVTVHLEDTRLTRYTGNYTAFEEMRAERMLLAQASYEKQKERIAHLQKFIDRFKAKASKAKQAQSRVKALARMEKLGPVLTSAEFQFEFREPLNLPNPMLAFSAVACGYAVVPAAAGYSNAPPEQLSPGRPEDSRRPLGGQEQSDVGANNPVEPGVVRPGAGHETAGSTPITIISGINRSVLAGQRIGILGANGQGKSTLVKTIVGQLPPLAGDITAGKGLSIGYFAQQELDVLQLEDGALMHMVRLARDAGPAAREQELRDFLGSFRFTGEMVKQPVGSLSGGEKARLVLAMLVWQRPNLLLLDEPTNHLDLDTREALSMALNEFEGTVMLVSHDRALLREVCDEFWLVSAGAVNPFDGDLDDYQRWLLDTSRELARAQRSGSAKAESAPVANGPANKRVDRKANAAARQKLAEQAKPLRAELTRLEQRLAALTHEATVLETEMARPDVSALRMAELGKRLKQINGENETLEARWLELSTKVEELTASAG